ncbi:LuxR family transcriptional regulator [Streptomyces sp. HD]|uniref:LuxR C-terminal-related transcriptional regulator n=1 Tax=Streptomyces sp. HD TaxID=3020892 RepID=UPI00232CAF9F|nr:LuxR family transcriptional regulator [Streptomyces sp. HD]MDC0771519.1 LuxR C-terminal-related transcriptional regulator [Streptomyces sp. HD]
MAALPAHHPPPPGAAPAEPPPGATALLSALIGLMPRAGSGPAPAVMLTGPAGIGRSTLLQTFCETVRSWAPVLRAGPLDGTWYDTTGAARTDAAVVQAPLDGGALSSHRLHETVVELCRRGPVVLAMDDAQLCRPRSLRGLGYVLRRSTGLPLLPVITVPTLPAATEHPAVTSLLAHHAWTPLQLKPLTETDVAELLTQRLGRRPDAALLRRCMEHSEGIPAAVHAFADRCVGTSAAGDTGRGAGPTTRTGPGALPGSASAVLSAVAALGSADPELVSELIRMPVSAVQRAMGHLTERRILSPEALRAGTDGSAGDVPHGISSDDLIPLYSRAARLLEDAGRPPTQVADVVLRIRYGAEPWMLEALYSAALDADSPGGAVRYLSHALDMGVDQDTRTLRRIRARLAETLTTTEPSIALHHLSTLLATSTDGRELADIALRYADTLVVLGLGDEAARLLAQVLDRPAGSGAVTVPEDCRPALESALLLCGSLRPASVRWLRERSQQSIEPAADSPGNRRLRLARTALSMLSGRPVALPDTPVPMAACAAGTPLDDLSLIASAVVAHLTDHTTTALDTLDRLLHRPVRRGLDPSRVQALMVRALVLCGTGDLPAAEHDSRRALELESRSGDGPVVAPAVTLAYVLAQRGEVAAAEHVLHEINGPDLQPLFYVHPMYWWATAAVRRAHGDLRGALVALRSSGRALGPGGSESPVLLPWWLEAADLLTELGRPAEARRVAARGGELVASWGTARSAGLALLARGLATPGRAGHRLLDKACAQLAESPARLLRARAEYALGVALLDDGDPLAARPRLRTALDLMIGCGAGNAAEGVRLRLAEAGGRPRRLTGRPGDALTERERRVAALAMAGRSNREIAEELYITRRTVELHLTHTYQKLGVSGREELVGVLQDTPGVGGSQPGGVER